MPIRREARFHYPIDWPMISAQIRFRRANGRCEQCGKPHGRLVRCLPDGRWYDEDAHVWRDDQGRPAEFPDIVEACRIRTSRVVLAACHRDHNPMNNSPRNLAAWCQRCHLRHDRDHHRRQAWITIMLRRALGDLFHGPYRRW